MLSKEEIESLFPSQPQTPQEAIPTQNSIPPQDSVPSAQEETTAPQGYAIPPYQDNGAEYGVNGRYGVMDAPLFNDYDSPLENSTLPRAPDDLPDELKAKDAYDLSLEDLRQLRRQNVAEKDYQNRMETWQADQDALAAREREANQPMPHELTPDAETLAQAYIDYFKETKGEAPEFKKLSRMGVNSSLKVNTETGDEALLFTVEVPEEVRNYKDKDGVMPFEGFSKDIETFTDPNEAMACADKVAATLDAIDAGNIEASRTMQRGIGTRMEDLEDLQRNDLNGEW